MVQVSATLTRQKIEHSLSREFLKNYVGYTFKFMSIVKSNESFKNKNFSNPYKLFFSPEYDILSIDLLLSKILSLNIKKQEEIYSICRDELGDKDINMSKVHTNLADIVNILSQEDFQSIEKNTPQNIFKIESKIEYNSLNFSRNVIEEYKIFQITIDNIYREFDIQGKNRSYSVFQIIKSNYIMLCEEFDDIDNDSIFLKLCTKIKEIVLNSKNYKEIPFEELEICINILIVDAFMRCKIFKNPEAYSYAAT